MRNLLFFFLIALAPVMGCTESMIIIGGDGGGTDGGGTDAGVDAPGFDAGPGIACGANTCRQGTFCCNESCGICAAEGGTCTEQACGEPVVCDGEVCADTAMCCGGCPGQPSTCSGPGGECPAVLCSGPVCGGVACFADSVACCMGCDGEEICGGPGGECPAISCPSVCDPQDVRMVGGCEPAPRFWWDGAECIGESGCDCEGADCDATFGDLATCEAAYSACTAPPVDCDVDDARGVGTCEPLRGYAWNGFSCVIVSGCSCAGTDCDSLSTLEDCEAAHRTCGPPPTCESDRECGEGSYCDSCARGSCELCEDCVSGCRPTECEGDGQPLLCDEEQPECGPDGVAIAVAGCWTCVVARTCVPFAEP